MPRQEESRLRAALRSFLLGLKASRLIACTRGSRGGSGEGGLYQYGLPLADASGCGKRGSCGLLLAAAGTHQSSPPVRT